MRIFPPGVMCVVYVTACVTACATDPSLAVHVDHDPAIAALVDRTVVAIYARPALTCAMIEFADVTDDELRGALAAEAEAGAPLDGIPRVDDKLVVARGYAADGRLIAAGCRALGVVGDAATITVTTVPTATVGVGLGLGMSEPRGLLVSTTDAANASIDARPVAWRLFGAAGTSADPARYTNVADGIWEPKAPTCTIDGDATIHPMPPQLPGGYALQVRVSWATAQPRLFSAFTSLDTTQLDVSLTATPAIAPCALARHGATREVVCLSSPTETTTYGYSVDTRSATPHPPVGLPAIANDPWVGVVDIDGSGGDRDVYALTNRGVWQAVGGAPAATTGGWCGAGLQLRCGDNFTTIAMQVVPACGDQPAYLLGQSTDASPLPGMVHLRKLPLRGGPVTELTRDGAIVGAGCVTELQLDETTTILRQAVVLELPGTVASPAFTAAVFDCAATRSPCAVALPSIGQAVAFTHGAEPQLIGTTFDATGASLVRWVVTPAARRGVIGPKDRLVERARQVAAAPPRRIVSGQFDADGLEDLVWAFTSHDELQIQLAYGREARGEPLSALTTVSTAANLAPQPVDVFATDFNDDGFDEVVFVVQTPVGALTATTVTIVPTGVPYGNPPSVPDDPACP
ncbi:MAG: hypothetical protein NT062_22640 [Proteobacteria bacterium]|nr:hypothetical protein [Pseudomonadota bacterium]